MRYLANLLFYLSLTLLIGAVQAASSEAEQGYQRLISSSPSRISSQVWEKALESYFSSCAGNNCKCTLIASEKLDGSTAITWIGNFVGGGARGMTFYSPMQESGHPAPGSGNDRSYAMPLKTCHTGNVKATGDNCCVVDASNKRSCGSENCKYYQTLAAQMGIPESRRIQKIYYASTLSGVFYLHESPYECAGQSCIATRGCLTLPANTMKSLCENYIGNDSEATGASHPENGGAFIYFKNTSFPQYSGASREKALRGYENYKSQCAGQSFASLYGGSSGAVASRNYQMGRQGNSAFRGNNLSTDSGRGSRSVASSGGNGFGSIWKAFMSLFQSGELSASSDPSSGRPGQAYNEAKKEGER